MFTRTAPQQAQHDTGFIVQVNGRYSIQYVKGELTVDMEADFAPTSGIYPETLSARHADGRTVMLSADERELILNRIESGLEFLGIKYEICKTPS